MKNYWTMYHKIANQMYKCGIEISDRLVADNVDDMALANTLAHEMLHTVYGCMNHGKEWKRLADIMNSEYGYNIQRATSAEEKGIAREESTRKEETYHYIIHCEKCNATWRYMRYCSIVKAAEKNKAKCGCGGKEFYVEKI